ncbi:MAG TPA: hypothetical protein VGZ73_03220 [Bryobacteraceae bacterium]|nr:hypothetical protein [Bryobacteraceae bacterium]
MDWLEKELSQALERKEPSPDFSARVAARAAAGEAVHRAAPIAIDARRPRVFTLPRWLPVAAAVLVIAGGSGAAWRRHQGMVAKDQVMLAMRITAGKLNHVQAHMREARQ